MSEFLSGNFFGRNKQRAAGLIFLALTVSLPILLFSNFDKLVKDKTLLEWIAENGLWSKAGMKFALLWFVGSAVVSMVGYGFFGFVSWLIDRRTVPTLEINFENRSPFISDAKGNSGITYKKRRVSVTSSLGGKVSLKIPALDIGTASHPNVQLRPIEYQADELEAGEIGYWEIVQFNTHERYIKLLHKGKDDYSLGHGSVFEIVARCGGMCTRKWVAADVRGSNLHFQLSNNPKELEFHPEPLPLVAQLPNDPTPTPRSLWSFFEGDFPGYPATMQNSTKITLHKVAGEPVIEAMSRVYMDTRTRVKFMAVYVPPSEHTFEVCKILGMEYKPLLERWEKFGFQQDGKGERPTESKGIPFNGRIFVYHETELSQAELDELGVMFRQNHADPQFRSQRYARENQQA